LEGHGGSQKFGLPQVLAKPFSPAIDCVWHSQLQTTMSGPSGGVLEPQPPNAATVVNAANAIQVLFMALP
jgi:hypothetical protein